MKDHRLVDTVEEFRPKCPFTSSHTASRISSLLRPANSMMRCEPRLLVMMMTVFLKSTVRP